MKSVSTIALGAAIALSGGIGVTAPAFAQAQQSRAFSLTAQERAAILPVQAAVEANNFTAAAAALPAAQRAAQGADARYIVAQYQLRTGIGLNNREMEAAAIDALIASGSVPAADLPRLYYNQGAYAASIGEYEKAERAFARLVELAPNDAEAAALLAEIRNDRGKVPEAVTLFDRSISLMEAAGQTVPEARYKRALKVAFDARVAPAAMKFARGLVTAYPTPENWRDAVLVHRDLVPADSEARLDLMRLMRASGALSGERDYLEMAQALGAAGLHGGAKAVLDEGVAKRMVDPREAAFREAIASANKQAASGKAGLARLETQALAAATGAQALGAGDAHLSYGEHTKAAALYQAAIQKGSIDPNVANTRLGIALALAGRKAEAEAAFRAVTGPRADIASLWLAWLARRA